MSTLRFAIGQMNPTVGDYAGNTRKILDWIRRADQRKADVTVFPELCLSGYPVWDMANKHGFVQAGLKHLDEIVRATRRLKTAVVLGYIGPGQERGDRSTNNLVWIQGGKIRARYIKRLLPTYDVFLEDIFFEAGTKSVVSAHKGLKYGLSICEDIWDEHYKEKPVQDLKRMGADIIVNISASPYYRGVDSVRYNLLRRHTKEQRRPILYVNQVGAQDDLLFDGRSMFVDAAGRLLFQAPPFREDLYFFDWDPVHHVIPAEAGINRLMDPSFRWDDEGFSSLRTSQCWFNEKPAWDDKSVACDSGYYTEEMYHALVLGIRDYCRKNNFQKIVIGVSGGIDSALVAALAADAVGPAAVLGVAMPGEYSSRGSWEDAKKLARNLGIEFRINPIKAKYRAMVKAYRGQKKRQGLPVLPEGKINLAMENLQARLRGMELMFISNDENRLVLATGNKSELAMGYCTLYGDMAGGLGVIGDLYKTDVYRLSWYRNSIKKVIPEASLTKPPSAELRPNQKDEDTLPPYDLLDLILSRYIEKNQSVDEIVRGLKPQRVSAGLVREVIRKVDHNEYKRRQTPPILRVTEKAWFGRRMPITNRFEA